VGQKWAAPQGPDPAKWSVEKIDANNILTWREIGGKVLYVDILENDEGSRIVYDGVDLGTYDFVKACNDVGGKPACEISDGKRLAILYKGKKYGTGYDNLDFDLLQPPMEKLAYAGQKNGRWFIVYDGVEYGREYEYVGFTGWEYEVSEEQKDLNPYYAVNDSGGVKYYLLALVYSEINGKLAYFAGRGNKEFLVYDGRELGGQYDALMPVVAEYKGKPIYAAIKNNKSFFVHDGQEIGTEYEGIWWATPMEVDGKLAYAAMKDNRSVLVYDGKEVGSCPEGYRFPTVSGYLMKIIQGKIAYSCWGSPHDIVVYDGKTYESDIGFFQEINGKLVYSAKNVEKGRRVLMYRESPDAAEEELGKGYDYIDFVTQSNGKIVYSASKGNEQYLIKER
jgi:hypothetical protein